MLKPWRSVKEMPKTPREYRSAFSTSSWFSPYDYFCAFHGSNDHFCAFHDGNCTNYTIGQTGRANCTATFAISGGNMGMCCCWQSRKSGRAFRVEPGFGQGSDLSLLKCFGPISGLTTDFPLRETNYGFSFTRMHCFFFRRMVNSYFTL